MPTVSTYLWQTVSTNYRPSWCGARVNGVSSPFFGRGASAPFLNIVTSLYNIPTVCTTSRPCLLVADSVYTLQTALVWCTGKRHLLQQVMHEISVMCSIQCSLCFIQVEELKAAKGITPGLVTILIGQNPASESYVRAKSKTAEELGYFSIQVWKGPVRVVGGCRQVVESC